MRGSLTGWSMFLPMNLMCLRRLRTTLCHFSIRPVIWPSRTMTRNWIAIPSDIRTRKCVRDFWIRCWPDTMETTRQAPRSWFVSMQHWGREILMRHCRGCSRFFQECRTISRIRWRSTTRRLFIWFSLYWATISGRKKNQQSGGRMPCAGHKIQYMSLNSRSTVRQKQHWNR